MDADRLVTEQLAYCRARAAEGDEWWEGRAEDDLEGGLRGAWRADALQLRAALERFAPSGDVLELAGGTGVFTAELLRHTDRVTVVDAAPEALAVNRARHPADAVAGPAGYHQRVAAAGPGAGTGERRLRDGRQ